MALPSVFRRREQRDVPARAADPFELLQTEVNRLFEDFWRGTPALPAEWSGAFVPRVDVAETEDAVEVTAELPGLDEKDFEVQLADDALVLRGEKRQEREEQQEGWYRSERVYGSFQRVIPLPAPVNADKAEAEFKNGVLRVKLPKSEEHQPRRIEVKAG